MVALVNGTFKTMMWNKLKVACAWSVPIILAADATPLAVDLAADDFKPMQQNDHRTFPPAPCAAVEPTINDVVFRDVARARRGKLEVYSRHVGIELNRCRPAFGGNEVRPFQKL